MKNNSLRLSRLLSALYFDPWLITPEMHTTLLSIVKAHAQGGEDERQQHQRALQFVEIGKEKDVDDSVEMAGNTMLIKAEGVFARKSASIINSSGLISTDVFERTIRDAGNNPSVRSILLVLDSPGGYSRGIPEAARAVREANAKKPVFAFVDGEAHSAAYWIASQCEAIYATESGAVGSIGCYVALLDQSEAYRKEGLSMRLYASGPYKGMGLPGLSLTPEQETLVRQEVEAIANEFKGAVLAGRGLPIAESVMQGQSFSSKEALENGLIDDVSDFATALRDVAAKEKFHAGRKKE